MKYTEYDGTTGRIISVGDSAIPPQDNPYLNVEAELFTDYVDLTSLTIKPRADMTVTVSNYSPVVGEEVIVSQLPIPTDIYINGPVNSEAVVDDGSLEVTFNLVGKYTITFESNQFLPETITINTTL